MHWVRGWLVWDEYETVSSFNRWSFGERRTKKGFLAMVWSWIFIDTSVNCDVYHRVFRRRRGVDSSFTSGVRVRTTTTCTPSATIKASRRIVVVQRAGKRRTVLLLVSNNVTGDDRTVVYSWLENDWALTNQTTIEHAVTNWSLLRSYIYLRIPSYVIITLFIKRQC